MKDQKQSMRVLWLALVTILIVGVCYYFVDRQVSTWLSQHHFRSLKELDYLSKIPELFIVPVPFLYFYVAIRFSLNKWSLIEQRLLMFANAIAISQFLKDFLKFIFGRYWPETWCNNLSFIKDQKYGFNYFHHGENYASFPSGHAATLMAAITILWLLFPRLWFLYIFIILASITGLLGMDFHFVGDIIAGGVLGYVVALYTFQITNRLNEKTVIR